MNHTEYMRLWRAKNKEKWTLYMQNFRQSHRSEIKAWRHQRYLKHRDEEKKYAVDWQKNNHEKFSAIYRASKAKEKYPGKLTASDIRGVLEREGRKCYWCGKDNLIGRDLTLEHLRPVNDPKFLRIACRSCNAKKFHRGVRRENLEFSD